MMKTVLEHLAVLLEYPEEHTAAHFDAALSAVREQCPGAARSLLQWGEYFCDTPLWEAQEAYTQTFDLNPSCSLDVGYYLFGEDYQRGVFMAHLRESQEAVGMEAGPELPDHLPVLLRWLARVYDTELYTDMTAECVVPVLRRMDEMLVSGRGATDRQNPYRHVLQAITELLAGDMAERGIPIAERRFRAPDLAAPGTHPSEAREGCGGPGISLEGVPVLSGNGHGCGDIQ
jgi:nitrate reductase molybdenum cofactor assembly chaperone